MRDTGIGCGFMGFIVGLLALILIIPLGIWGARVYFAEEIGQGNARIQIQSAESRITRYEYFFDLCASVQTAEQAIDSETKRLQNTNDERTRNQIMTNISAQEITRMNGINTYNADANKDYTSGQFLASNLPYQLSTEPYEPGGTRTRCAS